MQLTFEQVNEILNEASKIEDDKFQYCIKKILNQAQKIKAKEQKKIQELQIDYCSVDEKGNVLHNDKGGYVYTKENLKELNKKINELNENVHEFAIFKFKNENNIAFTEDQKELFWFLFE